MYFVLCFSQIFKENRTINQSGGGGGIALNHHRRDEIRTARVKPASQMQFYSVMM